MNNLNNNTHLPLTKKAAVIYHQVGFTLIEMIIVIVLLGILSVIAAPRYLDMSDEAYKAAVTGTSGAFSAGLILIRSEAVMSNVIPHTSMEIDGQHVVFNQDLKPYDVSSTEVTSTAEKTGSADGCLKLWNIILQDGAPTIEQHVSGSTGYTSDYSSAWVAATSAATSTEGCTYSYQLDPGRIINWNKVQNKLIVTNP